jgi:hypothetical protein
VVIPVGKVCGIYRTSAYYVLVIGDETLQRLTDIELNNAQRSCAEAVNLAHQKRDDVIAFDYGDALRVFRKLGLPYDKVFMSSKFGVVCMFSSDSGSPTDVRSISQLETTG